jgi:hypothetical protein
MVTFNIDFDSGASGSGWTVNRDGKACGSFADKSGATLAAIHAAQYTGRIGPKSAQVMVTDHGMPHLAWKYGDFYAPFAA